MPERNYIWESRQSAAADGKRRLWRIIPCHADAQSSPEVRTIPGTAIAPGYKIKRGHDKTALGMQIATATELDIDLWAIDSDLKAAITDSGVVVQATAGYSVEANTVWILLTDGGNGALDWGLFTEIETVGVQVYQMGDKIESTGRMKITLLDPIKLLMERLTMKYFVEGVRANVHYYGGGGGYSYKVKKRLYEFAALDGDSRLHALMEWGQGSEEAILIRWSDVWGQLWVVLLEKWGKLIRSSVNLVFAAYTTDGTTESTVSDPNPLSFVTMYRKSLSTDGARGTALAPTDQMIIGWIRRTGAPAESDGSDLIGGLLFQHGGLAEKYKTVWDWIVDLCPTGAARGMVTYDRVSVLSVLQYRATIRFQTLWNKPLVSATMPSSGQYEKWSAVRADNVCYRATSQIQIPRGKDINKHEVLNDGLSENLGSIDCQFLLHNMPCIDTEENVHLVKVPSSNASPQFTAGDLDFNSTVRCILGRTGFTAERFYYLQPSASGGGPAWITANGETEIAMAVHHAVDMNDAGFAGDYALTDTIIPITALPSSPLEYEGTTLFYYLQTVWGAWLIDLAAMQRKSWPAAAAYLLALLHGNRGQTTVEVEIAKPHPYTQEKSLSVWSFSPGMFDASLFGHLAQEASIIEAEYGQQVDKLTFAIRPTSQ